MTLPIAFKQQPLQEQHAAAVQLTPSLCPFGSPHLACQPVAGARWCSSIACQFTTPICHAYGPIVHRIPAASVAAGSAVVGSSSHSSQAATAPVQSEPATNNLVFFAFASNKARPQLRVCSMLRPLSACAINRQGQDITPGACCPPRLVSV